MEEGEVKNLIKVWHQKTKMEGGSDKISKFVFLWICFNAWLAYRSGEDTDRGMVDCLKRKDPVVIDIVSQYEKALESEWFKRENSRT